MPVSEAKKKANYKYDSAHYANVACRLRKEEAEAFKAECKNRNTTPNAVLKKAINDFMENIPE